MEKNTQLEIMTKLSKEFGNDQDLGKQYRKFIFTTYGKLDEFCLQFPNDFELGKFLRKKIKN